MASAFAAITAVFTAVPVENTDETAVTKTAAISVKFSSHRSKMTFSVDKALIDKKKFVMANYN